MGRVIDVIDGDVIELYFGTEGSGYMSIGSKQPKEKDTFYFKDIEYVKILTPSEYRKLMLMSWLPRMFRRWVIIQTRIWYIKLRRRYGRANNQQDRE